MIKKIDTNKYEVWGKDVKGNEVKIIDARVSCNDKTGEPVIAWDKLVFGDLHAADDLGVYLFPKVWQRTT